jgi:hypothetical protein
MSIHPGGEFLIKLLLALMIVMNPIGELGRFLSGSIHMICSFQKSPG